MRFAKVVFLIGGIWGLVLMTPLYFLIDVVGRQYPPPITHPDLYFGFVTVTLVWQIAFLIIATDPIRYRPMMIAAVLEKGLYIAMMATLYLRGEIEPGQFAVVSPDLVLAALFVAAFIRTPARTPSLLE